MDKIKILEHGLSEAQRQISPIKNRKILEHNVKILVEDALAQNDNYFEIIDEIACIFPGYLKEQLIQLVNGPVYDGDVISKSDRGALFDMGLAIRVCCKGEQGYTGAPYIAYSIVKAIKNRSS